MLFQDVVFWFLAVLVVGGALGVVLIPDLFRAALLLVLVFVGVAGFFVLMSAEFLAVVQVLIYAGAVSILIIFGIMLTRDVQRGNLPNRWQIPAVLFSSLLLASMVVVAVGTNWELFSEADESRAGAVHTSGVRTLSLETDRAALERAGFSSPEEQRAVQEAGLADLLIGKFVLPFEGVSLLLLAAVIGALVLVRPR
ncbi:MAG: NADH-quinone oxidoreductase subunit J [Chloroflexi bacterium]|nr:NADH-quinone oxidoreductase subunit J [Chloroflexota bacterium]MCH8349540.1 NADH-quinone oxidoreductase subunit J [Chloroflexota bacterium]MCI0786629.1 NADH-quinone oxidoreductase subunit J [Chloroflexota bacterium]MCI0795049.1 NADH-quinone oxidoreductase subunit J [Chloroflexota bacterium]MCI0798953.1 NADH-quinone oxidoreductase subunit J [Chloroflexota bacterium]